MQFTILAALSKNYVIGNKGKIPWHIPEDLKRFKKLTVNHTVIMGRKTYRSILNRLQKPLPQRKNIIVTLNPHFHDERVLIAHSLEEAVVYCDVEKENFVIGGEKIFKLFLPQTNKIGLTWVKGTYQGDAFFPRVDFKEWRLIQEDEREHYSFHIYERVTHSA